MGQHHAVGVAASAQLDHGVGPSLEGRFHVESEAVHAEDEALVGQRAQVVDVLAVAGMTQHDSGWIDSFLVAQTAP